MLTILHTDRLGKRDNICKKKQRVDIPVISYPLPSKPINLILSCLKALM